MLTQTCAAAIIEALKATLEMPNMVRINNDPFETLILTIISQNTADSNTGQAFQNLKKRFSIIPKTLATTPIKELEKCLHVGGLYKSKAQTIKTVSKIILENFRGTMGPILSLSMAGARKTLMEMPGVGPKTADVVLLFSANQPTIPVDTHVNRVSKRLGLAPVTGGYEEVRQCLQSQFEPKDYLFVHLLLIAHGRKYCKARQPLCQKCPVNSLCASNALGASA